MSSNERTDAKLSEDNFLRVIKFDGKSAIKHSPFVTNEIKKSNNNILWLTPKVLLLQFLKESHLWFIFVLIVILIFDDSSNKNYIVSLFCFFIILSILKDLFKQFWHHRYEKSGNFVPVNCWNGHEFIEKYCKDLFVGDIILLYDKQIAPADILLLAVGNEERECFVDAYEIFGDRNLRIKYPIKCTQATIASQDLSEACMSIRRLDGTLRVSTPSKSFSKFSGKLKLKKVPKAEVLTFKNTIWKGTTIVSQNWILGIVVYTGSETKVSLNWKNRQRKQSKVDKTISKLILISVIIVVFITLISFTVQINIPVQYLDKNDDKCDDIINQMFLYYYLVPLTLFICLYSIRLLQWYRMHKIFPSIHFKAGEISEDLGQIEYILTDKTGTLTKNELTIQVCIVGETQYWEEDNQADFMEIDSAYFQSSETRVSPLCDTNPTTLRQRAKSDSNRFSDLKREILETEKKNNIFNFFLCMAVCNSMFSEQNGELTAISADERILVGTAQKLGVKLVSRSQYHCEIKINDDFYGYEIMGLLPFTSETKVSMILVRKIGENESILLAKGNKEKMLNLFDLEFEEKSNIEEMTLLTRGLIGMRILIFGYKKLSRKETDLFLIDYKNAKYCPVNKEGRIESVFEKYQNKMQYLGMVGLEDKISEETKDTVNILTQAGIKLWILSGDSEESTIRAGVGSGIYEESVRMIRMTNFKSEEHCLKEMQKQVEECIYHKHKKNSWRENEESFNKKRNWVRPERIEISEEANSEPNLLVERSQEISMKNLSDENILKMKRSSDIKQLEKIYHESLQIFLSNLTDNKKGKFTLDGHFNPNSIYYVVSVDKSGLEYGLSSRAHRECFAALLFSAHSVIFHSLFPDQKRKVVKFLKNNFDFKPVVLAVGDGNNDLGMIQEAHIGVAIRGNEGRYAENAADIVINDFSQLKELLFYIGNSNYRRICNLVLTSFYTKFLLVTVLFYFNGSSQWSGGRLFGVNMTFIYIFVFNTFLVGVYGIYDEDLSWHQYLEHPQAYSIGFFRPYLSFGRYFLFAFKGIVQGTLIYSFIYNFAHGYSTNGNPMDLEIMGFIVFIVLCLSLGCVLLIESGSISKYTLGGQIVSLLALILASYLFTYDKTSTFWLVGIFDNLQKIPSAWIFIFTVPLFAVLISYWIKSWTFIFFPSIIDKIKSLKAHNYLFEIRSRLYDYISRLHLLYKDSCNWRYKLELDAFEIDKWKLKFASEIREKEYQIKDMNENFISYRTIFVILIFFIIAYQLFLYWINADNNALIAIYAILPSLSVWYLTSLAPVLKNYYKWLVLVFFTIISILILLQGIFTETKSSQGFPLLIIVGLTCFNSYWHDLSIFYLFLVTCVGINICIQSGHDYSSAEVILKTFEYMNLYVSIYIESSIIGYCINKSKRSEYVLYNQVQLDFEKSLAVLSYLLPPFVMNRVKNGDRAIAEDQGIVSVLFCDIDNFDSIIENYQSQEITAFLGEIFGKLDQLCDLVGVTKIETVGKTYMACAGLIECEAEMDPTFSTVPQARRAVEMGLAILRTAKTIYLKNGEALSLKIGINSGNVTAGVVGYHKPQFSLVGDTVNTASRMATTLKEPNSIQISMATYNMISDKRGLDFISKIVYVKGKGEMETWLVSVSTQLGELPSPTRDGPIQNYYYSSHELSPLPRIRQNNQKKLPGKRSSLFRRLDIQDAESIFKKSNTELSLRSKWLLCGIVDDEKEKGFRHEIRTLNYPIYHYGLLIGSICISFCAIIEGFKTKYGNGSYIMMTKFICESVSYIIMLFVMKRYYKTRTYAKTLHCVYCVYTFVGIILAFVGGHLSDELCIGFYYHMILVTHCSLLIFKEIFWTAIFFCALRILLISIDQKPEFATFILSTLTYTGFLLYIIYNREFRIRKLSNLKAISKKEHEKTETLNKKMMPPHVYQKLKEEIIITDNLQEIPILYADIVGFTSWAACNSPKEVVRMLSELFTRFDKFCVENNIYKVHTIGDCYVAMAYNENEKESRDPIRDCVSMIDFAQTMINIIKEVNEKNHTELNMRIGLHVGNVIGGITGTNLIRYDIYGTDVQIANKMESHGEPGKIVVSETIKEMMEILLCGKYIFEFWKKITLHNGTQISSYVLLDAEPQRSEIFYTDEIGS